MSVKSIQAFQASLQAATLPRTDQGRRVSGTELEHALEKLTADDGQVDRAEVRAVSAAFIRSGPSDFTRFAKRAAHEFLEEGAAPGFDVATRMAMKADFALRAINPGGVVIDLGREVTDLSKTPSSVRSAAGQMFDPATGGHWDSVAVSTTQLAGQDAFIVTKFGLDGDEVEEDRIFTATGREVARGRMDSVDIGFNWDDDAG